MTIKTKAIILAAGSGNRIAKAAAGVPKPLLPLDGVPGSITFIDRHIECLEKAGVTEIYLIGNPITFGTKVRASQNMKVEWILNPTENLSETGSGHSTFFAFKSPLNVLDSKSRVLLMDADIAYDERIMIDFLATDPKKGSLNLIYPRFEETSEEVLVFEKNGKPSLIGKGLHSTPLSQGLTCLGEATGITLWAPEDHIALKAVTEWLVQYSTTKKRIEHEDISQRMMSIGKVGASIANADYPFMEVDTPEEYQVLIHELYPKLVLRK